MQGIATTFSDKEHGSVQVTPLTYVAEDNRLVFGAAAFNKSESSTNFSLDGISATWNGTPLKLYTRDELAREARVKAAWQAAAVILAGAAAAYSASQDAYRTTNGTVSTMGGRPLVNYTATTYDPGAARLGQLAAGAATGYGLVQINNSLDNTIASLDGSILQMNTVDPGRSAGGSLVIDMPKDKKALPQPISISVNWNGDVHSFSYNVVEKKD
jgi:hypothetical protein